MLKIRDFSVDDAESLTEISNEAFGDEITRGMSPFSPKRFLDLSEKTGVRVIVAEDNGNILGFLALAEGDIEVAFHDAMGKHPVGQNDQLFFVKSRTTIEPRK